MARLRSWTDTDLRNAVAVATSWRDTARALALAPSGHTHQFLRKRAWALGLSTAHFDSRSFLLSSEVAVDDDADPQRQFAHRWGDDELAEAVYMSRSWAGVHHRLGLVIGGSTMLQRRAARLGLDVSHFDGQGWRKGSAVAPPGVAIPLKNILVENSTYGSTHSLRLRLIKEGFKQARCERCGTEQWNGLPAPLQLDHINGRRTDNRLENLRILCPNCHAQTDTWCGKNQQRARKAIEELRPGSPTVEADVSKAL